MSVGRGIPLLSGPPPLPSVDANESASCRKCNREFNVLFARSRRCNHCGYLYCHSCTDYQALMPRGGTNYGTSGYDPAPVCTYCIEDLTITADGKGQLRGLSLAKLKKYAKDYNIDINDVLEKDTLIDRLIATRGPNGCLPPANENYYRKYSVPNRTTERPRSILSRAMDALSSERQGSAGPSQQHPPQSNPQYQPRTRTTSHPTNTFPRPDLDREHQQQDREPRAEQRPEPQYQQPQPNSRHSNPNSYPNVGSQSNFRNHSYTRMPEPDTRYTGASSANLNVPPSYNPRPRSSSAPRTPTAQPAPSTRATSPSPSVPSLDELLAMPPENIRALSISHLKAILFRNHVTMGTVVEKSELVAKVERLVEDEKLEREVSRRREEEEEAEREEREMAEAIERSRREHEENEMRERARERQANQGDHEEAPSSAPAAETAGNTPMSPKAQAMASHLERTGLCVICQDDEANIAIVDCGHLAMCRNCSDLIMASTKECPLCRTRIITEARLLRIFKS